MAPADSPTGSNDSLTFDYAGSLQNVLGQLGANNNFFGNPQLYDRNQPQIDSLVGQIKGAAAGIAAKSGQLDQDSSIIKSVTPGMQQDNRDIGAAQAQITQDKAADAIEAHRLFTAQAQAALGSDPSKGIIDALNIVGAKNQVVAQAGQQAIQASQNLADATNTSIQDDPLGFLYNQIIGIPVAQEQAQAAGSVFNAALADRNASAQSIMDTDNALLKAQTMDTLLAQQTLKDQAAQQALIDVKTANLKAAATLIDNTKVAASVTAQSAEALAHVGATAAAGAGILNSQANISLEQQRDAAINVQAALTRLGSIAEVEKTIGVQKTLNTINAKTGLSIPMDVYQSDQAVKDAAYTMASGTGTLTQRYNAAMRLTPYATGAALEQIKNLQSTYSKARIIATNKARLAQITDPNAIDGMTEGAMQMEVANDANRQTVNLTQKNTAQILNNSGAGVVLGNTSFGKTLESVRQENPGQAISAQAAIQIGINSFLNGPPTQLGTGLLGTLHQYLSTNPVTGNVHSPEQIAQGASAPGSLRIAWNQLTQDSKNPLMQATLDSAYKQAVAISTYNRAARLQAIQQNGMDKVGISDQAITPVTINGETVNPENPTEVFRAIIKSTGISINQYQGGGLLNSLFGVGLPQDIMNKYNSDLTDVGDKLRERGKSVPNQKDETVKVPTYPGKYQQ